MDMARTGRPRAFDRDQAVTAAMHLFWQHGFEGVSLEQLRHAMGGISSASFYAAFASKEALYRETLAVYLDTHGKVMSALGDKSLPPRSRIETALRGSASMQTATDHPTGCMVALSATVSSEASAALQTLTRDERAANRAAIRACVREAIAAGSLRADTDEIGLATLLEAVLVGLSIQARDGLGHAEINAAVAQGLACWDAHAPDKTV
jgi:AcrR family transcriptional regulator